MTPDNAPAHDVSATLSRLFVYPVKSCAGVEVHEAVLTETGLDLDRAWMLVDEQGEFLSQRELPRMALIRPQLRTYEMVLRAPGMLALHITIDAVEQPTQARVWDDVVKAYDMGDTAAQWFSDFLSEPGQPARRLRMVRFDPDHPRYSDSKWTGEVKAQAQFSDAFALLVTSEASLALLNGKLAAAGHGAVGMERFRPNIVLSGIEAHDEDRLDTLRVETASGPVVLRPVKPCTRCTIPNVDPASAESAPHVSDILQGYRQNARMGGGVTFGMNAIVLDGVDHVLHTGQNVRANYRFG